VKNFIEKRMAQREQYRQGQKLIKGTGMKKKAKGIEKTQNSYQISWPNVERANLGGSAPQQRIKKQKENEEYNMFVRLENKCEIQFKGGGRGKSA